MKYTTLLDHGHELTRDSRMAECQGYHWFSSIACSHNSSPHVPCISLTALLAITTKTKTKTQFICCLHICVDTHCFRCGILLFFFSGFLREKEMRKTVAIYWIINMTYDKTFWLVREIWSFVQCSLPRIIIKIQLKSAKWTKSSYFPLAIFENRFYVLVI